MKKIVVLFIFLSLSEIVYADLSETWYSYNLGYKFTAENYKSVNSTPVNLNQSIQSIGFNGYDIWWWDNMGIAIPGGISFPISATNNLPGSAYATVPSSEVVIAMDSFFALAFAYRWPSNSKNSYWYITAGPMIGYYFELDKATIRNIYFAGGMGPFFYDSNAVFLFQALNIGAEASIGNSYRLSKKWDLSFGIVFSTVLFRKLWGSVYYDENTATIDIDELKYYSFSFNPYIGFTYKKSMSTT
jgi:hypothetical protein